MYRLEYTERARRDIQGLPSQKIRDQVEAALLRLAKEPGLGKGLMGDFSGLWSYRTGDWRILYKVYRSEIRVLVITIGNRRDVYGK